MTTDFDTQLSAARSLLASQDPLFGDPGDVGAAAMEREWPASMSSPIHRAFLLLSELYLDAQPDQREVLSGVVKGLDLGPFISEVSALIRSPDDTRWMRIGLAAAGLDSGQCDDRDLLVGLGVLVGRAERAGVNVESSLAEARAMSPDIAHWLREEYLLHLLDDVPPPR